MYHKECLLNGYDIMGSQMPLITLEHARLLGSGNERLCFVHPENERLCIKVTKPGVTHRSQNAIEQQYFEYLKEQATPFTYLPEYYGVVQTNYGPGLVFERILDDNNQPSQRLDALIKNHEISNSCAAEAVEELQEYLLKYGIMLGDINPDQILMRREKRTLKPVIIDGVGPRHLGFKSFVYTRVTPLARYKLKKNWPILVEGLGLAS